MRSRWSVLGVLLVSLLFARLALAQGSSNTSWTVIAGGGGICTGKGYTLSGTAGQASTATSSGNGYTLTSGYWTGSDNGGTGSGSTDDLYLPLIAR